MNRNSGHDPYEQAGRLAGLSRRGFLGAAGAGVAAAGSLGLRDLVALRAEDLQKKGLSVIVLWMQGGPSQFETFDPKPGHDNGGPTGAIKTAVPGIQVAEHWPLVAEQMKDIALVRSMTNREGNHQRATYQLHTGYAPTGSVKHPSLGSLISKEVGDASHDLPQFVAIGSSRGLSGISGGFLGVNYDPFSVASPDRPLENTTVPAGGARLGRALGLLNKLEGEFAGAGAADRVKEHRALYAKARKLATSKQLEAFKISAESEKNRELYGAGSFGKGCLLARRLVEAGTRVVEVVWPKVANSDNHSWDVHVGLPKRMKDQSAPMLDGGLSGLITDLDQRGMLDETMVVAVGEFGRSPNKGVSTSGNSNDASGRDHWPYCYT
ncbi:MAG: DUF1501 domain-containing protein, partial [Planctomycetota bacterium]|nr:DUF1501 domain-containing protein [Planctomycetota bacterium]